MNDLVVHYYLVIWPVSPSSVPLLASCGYLRVCWCGLCHCLDCLAYTWLIKHHWCSEEGLRLKCISNYILIKYEAALLWWCATLITVLLNLESHKHLFQNINMQECYSSFMHVSFGGRLNREIFSTLTFLYPLSLSVHVCVSWPLARLQSS